MLQPQSFVVRRVVFATLVFLTDGEKWVWLQYAILWYSTLVVVVVQIHFATISDREESVITLFNELCFGLVLYSSYGFSDLSLDAHPRSVMSYCVIALQVGNVVTIVGWGLLKSLIAAFRKLKHYCTNRKRGQ